MLTGLFWTFMATAVFKSLNLYLPQNATLLKVTPNGRKGLERGRLGSLSRTNLSKALSVRMVKFGTWRCLTAR